MSGNYAPIFPVLESRAPEQNICFPLQVASFHISAVMEENVGNILASVFLHAL